MSAAFPVNDNPRFVLIATTNGQTSLTIPFPFLDNGDIRIIKTAVNGVETELDRPANFSLTGRGNPAGGSALLTAAARTGETYLVLGHTIPTRTQDVTRAGKFSSAAIDEDLDRLTLMVQELRRDMEQAFTAKFGTAPGEVAVGADGTLPMWDAEGNLVVGPHAAAIEAIEVALGVEAGRALVHGAGGADPYAAGGRKIAGLATATEPDEAINKAQLDALSDILDPEGLIDRVEKLETGWVTGDFKSTLDPLDQPGWIEGNALSIGSASSNATGRANADTFPLFAFFWHVARRAAWDIAIFTSAGAPSTFGADAASDFAANKRLRLPNLSKRFPRTGGADLYVGTLQENQNREHNHAGSTGKSGKHGHAAMISARNDGGPVQTTYGGFGLIGLGAGSYAASDQDSPSSTAGKQIARGGEHDHSVTINNSGGDEARPDSFVVRGLIRL